MSFMVYTWGLRARRESLAGPRHEDHGCGMGAADGAVGLLLDQGEPAGTAAHADDERAAGRELIDRGWSS